MKPALVAALLAALHSSQPYAAITDSRPVVELTDDLEARIVRLTERLEKIRAQLDKKEP